MHYTEKTFLPVCYVEKKRLCFIYMFKIMGRLKLFQMTEYSIGAIGTFCATKLYGRTEVDRKALGSVLR